MILRKVVEGVYDGHASFTVHNYSSYIDVDLYKGGYDNLFIKYYYSAPDKSEVSKKINIVCIYENAFNDNGTCWAIDKFKFLKSIEMGNDMVSHKCFIFSYEEPSITEIRSEKLEIIL
jgi:hypothetical protein